MNFNQGLEVADEAVFTKVGRRLNHAESAVLKGSWEHKTYEEIAKDTSYSVSYLKQGVGPKLWKILTQALSEQVSKTNFKSTLERRWRLQQSGDATQEQRNVGKSPSQDQADWGEAIDVSKFYGRTQELATLEKWIVCDRTRLVTILGMGGMGKTALVTKLAQQVQPDFEYIIWRSLRNAPPVEEILAELLQFLTPKQLTDLPKTLMVILLNS